jgi:hypothetical protein
MFDQTTIMKIAPATAIGTVKMIMNGSMKLLNRLLELKY